MSEIAIQILNTFSTLPEFEQREVLLALLRESREFQSSSLSDDQLIHFAEEVFLKLDEEEMNGIEGGSR